MKPFQLKAAFSLVELSIVLVLLGLLAGAVVTGQNLIRASQLRSVPTEFNAYQTAALTFLEQYGDLPGDLRNATHFFGQTATCPPTGSALPADGKTCNGNGNSLIDAPAITANESFTFWQHLALAGMIEGSYTGSTAHASVYSTASAEVGVNIPESRIAKAGWYIVDRGEILVSNTTFVEGNYNNTLHFGLEAVGAYPYNDIFTPEEAWNIDSKMDDGLPGSGVIVSYENKVNCYTLADGSAGSFTASDIRTNIQYKLSDKSKRCALVFKDVF